MNAVTRLDRADLEAVLGRYDVGEPVDFWPAAHGIENSNYFVRTRNQGILSEWVITILEQAPNAGAVFAPLLDLCFAAGLPVAPVRRNAAGKLRDGLRGKPLLLTPRLRGRHPQAPSAAQVAALGDMVARLHLTTRNPSFATPNHPRDEGWLTHMAKAASGQLTADGAGLLGCGLRRVKSLLRGDDLTGLPAGIIHGDLFRDNVLFDGDRLTGLLDFHHAANGWLIYDLAVAANDWCSDPQGRLKAGQANALLAAYHQRRPLKPAEIERFPDFMAYAALAFWLSRLSAAARAQAGEAVRVKNPDEFQRIIADRLSGEFRPKIRI
ncbi:MAG: homoserine kinase [Gammaproteobacteria bacterium]|nr:homoserine kinase [Gammaproteobacteria bacterium]